MGRNRRTLAALVLSLAVLPLTSAQASVRVGLSAADPVMAGTTTTSTTQLYAFASVIGGKPVRWNPCVAMHWRFNPANAPVGGLTTLKAAIARVALATGTTWAYDGTTTAVPRTSWLPKDASLKPVLIGWTDAAHSDLLAGQSASVLGVTRTSYVAKTVGTLTIAATRAGVIALDRTNVLPLTGAVSWRTTILHELSHGMGLAHVGNSHEMMYPVLQRTLLDLQLGDLAGLAKVGRAAGCISLGF